MPLGEARSWCDTLHVLARLSPWCQALPQLVVTGPGVGAVPGAGRPTGGLLAGGRAHCVVVRSTGSVGALQWVPRAQVTVTVSGTVGKMPTGGVCATVQGFLPTAPSWAGLSKLLLPELTGPSRPPVAPGRQAWRVRAVTLLVGNTMPSPDQWRQEE